MAALNVPLTLAILIYIRRRLRRRQTMSIKKLFSNFKIWVRPTIADKSTASAFQSTFLVAKELDRLTMDVLTFLR